MALVFDYSDARALIGGKPLSCNLRPDYIPIRERETIQCVKVKRNGQFIHALTIDGEEFKLQAI